MQLKELVENILVGKLSNTSLAASILGNIEDLNDAAGTAQPIYHKNLGKLIRVINAGMTKIYTKVDLAKEEIFLDTNSAMDRYVLSIEHAEYAGAAYDDHKHIIDTALYPFRDNIIECLYVADEFGAQMYTNDSAATWNVNFPKPNVIQVPFADSDITLSIIYKANHPKIPFALNKSLPLPDSEQLGYTLPEMEIELPEFLHDALVCFVEYKYFQSVGSQESSAQAQTSYAEYIEAVDSASTTIHGNFTEIDTLANGGWV